MNIGSIVLNWFTPSVQEDDTPAGKGLPSVTISGAGPHLIMDELRELLRNYRARVTKAGVTGIQQYVEFDCASLDSWDGWYLFTGFSTSVDKIHMDAIASTDIDLGHGDTAVLTFSLKGVYLGSLVGLLDGGGAPGGGGDVIDGGSP